VTTVPGLRLDPLLAEARRRARRRRLALLALVLAGAGAGAGVWRLTAGTPAPSPRADEARIAAAARRTFVGEAGLTAGVGWAMNGLGLWVTRDGGRTWITATPPHVRTAGDAVARIGDIQFVDRDHGWLAAADVAGGFPLPRNAPSRRHMEIDRTTDGGRTWRASVPPGCLEACGGTHLAFVDATHGFASAAQGFFATGDGTRTHAQRLVLYTSADGGASWTAHVAPAGLGWSTSQFTWGVPASGLFSAASPRTWVVNGGRVLFATTDAGASWRSVRPLDLPPRATIREAQLISADDGWAIFRLPKGNGGSGALVRTTDGGLNWTALAPPVPRLPPFPKPKPLCGSACRRP